MVDIFYDIILNKLVTKQNQFTELKRKFITISDGYTALPEDDVILIDAPDNSVKLDLPLCSLVIGKQYTFKVLDNTNTISIQPQSPNLIDGELSLELESLYDSVTIVSDGLNWHLI